LITKEAGRFKIQRPNNIKPAYVECERKVIPVTTGATGTITKSLRQYLSNIRGKHEIKEIQKTAILGTAHKLQKVLT
jgi:hypothetical protein